MLDTLISQLANTSMVEALAVAFGIAYLLLAIRESIWCWPCALVSTALYIYLFHDVALLSESALNLFYLVMAIYGWWQWRGGMIDKAAPLKVTSMPGRRHGQALVVIAALVAITGAALTRWTDADFAYIDAATSWSAVWATWLTARKILENWYYWFVIDAVSIALYLQKALVLTALLFAVYLVLVVFGIRRWRRSYRESL